MRAKIAELRIEANTLTGAAKAESAVSLIRIVVQHAALSLAEWVVDRYRNGASVLQNQEIDLSDLRAPADGTLVGSLLKLVVVAENLGWNGLAGTVWGPVSDSRPAHSFSASSPATLESVLHGFVTWRNNEVYGHGIPNEEQREELIDLLDLLLDRLGSLLPHFEDDEHFVLANGAGNRLKLNILRPVHGDLACYRQIRMLPNGRCIVRAQRQLSLQRCEDAAWETEDILAFRSRDEKSYSLWETGDPAWCPIVLVPSRLTHHFSGRKSELAQLKDWIDDVESRACMLYGDGGMGKTTLAIEFVHRLLDGSLSSTWQPEMVTFYTAKQTVWGIDGVKYIRATPGTLTDLAAEIYRSLSGEPADRTWFDKSPEAVVDKLSGFLAEWNIDRKKHLLVLDNTETMAAAEEDVRLLAGQILKLARKVGRILVTSRRREPIEARQIEVPALAQDESVALLRNRAKELGRQPILQAGDAKLRQIASKLGNRPLTLEVFLQTLSDDRLGLDRAFDRVLQMERKDLGEFLYADAWRRFSPRIQSLLLLMSRVSDVHDEGLLKLCCQQAGVSITEAYDALSESRGIATLTRVDGHIQVVLNNDFMQFAAGKEVKIDGIKSPTENAIESVRRRYIEFLKSKSAHVRDRISIAYRTPFARMAYQAFKEGRFEECENAYEMAVVEDPDNALLYDRYAYTLFTVRRYEDALSKAKEATRLSPSDGECWFTRGLIESRLGTVNEAEESLTRAMSLGKPKHLCYLQLGYAYANAQPPRTADGFSAVVRARQIDSSDRGELERKHLSEVRALEQRLANLATPDRKRAVARPNSA